MTFVDELRTKCRSWATAEHGMTRTLGIWGSYVLCLGGRPNSVEAPWSNESYIEELARLERTFAVSRLLRARQANRGAEPGVSPSRRATAAVEERV